MTITPRERMPDAPLRAIAGLVDSCDLAVIVTDTRLEIVSANAAVETVFGYQPEQLIGRDSRILFPPDAVGDCERTVRALKHGRVQPSFVSQRVRSDGVTIDVSVTPAAVRDEDGHVVGFSVLVADITEHMQARARLARSEQLAKACFEDAPLPQAMIGADRRIVDVNRAACELIGHQREALIGVDVRDLLVSRAAAVPDAEIRAALREGTAAWERAVVRSDGTVLPLLVQIAVVDVPDQPAVLLACLQDLTQLKSLQRQLGQRESYFRALERHAAEWVALLDADGNLRYVSPSMQVALIGRETAVTRESPMKYVHRADRDAIQSLFADVCADPHTLRRGRVRLGVGTRPWHWLDFVLVNELDDPDVGGIVFSARDVTAAVEAEEALRRSEARYRTILQTAHEGIWAVDPSGRVLFANEKIAEILGVSLEALYGSDIRDVLAPERAKVVLGRMRGRARTQTFDYDVAHETPCGEQRVVHVTSAPLSDDSGYLGVLMTVTDITGARAIERQLRRQALYDDLTGLPNRFLLRDRVEHALARSRTRDGAQVAVILIDLDHFKLVNDSWGHPAGDHLLVQVGERLAGAARDADTLGRFGGDEFVVVAEAVDAAGAREIARRVEQALSEPFDLNGQRLHVTASIGVAVSPPHSAEELMRFADTAMNDAKTAGRARIEVFDVATAAQANQRLSLSNELRDALGNDELALHYQPVVDLASGSITGVEALLRWPRPDGDIAPDVFVPLAEEVGLSAELDGWVLRRASEDLERLQSLLGRSTRIAVNISATIAGSPEFETLVRDVLASQPNAASSLTLEITETALMNRPEETRRVLERLRPLGVRISVDDFGTGYSSLAYLSKLPVDTLKIDRTFIETITTDPDALALAASIADLARGLRLSTVAEGVETAEQQLLLHSLGCNAGQGFVWLHATDLDNLEQVVAQLPGGAFPGVGEVLGARRGRRPLVTACNGLTEIIRLHRDGASPATIASALNQGGFRTPSGTRWHRASVSRVVADIGGRRTRV